MWLRHVTASEACRGWLGVCLFSVLAVPMLRAQPAVELEVQTPRPYVNETIWVKVRVHDAQNADVPDFPKLPNCQVAYVGPESRTHVSIVPGGRQVIVEKAYQYRLTPFKPGTLTIPAIPVVVDGKTLKTEPTILTVRALPESHSPRKSQGEDAVDDAGELLLAEITCEQSQLYVGQQADFTLTIWVKTADYRGHPLRQSEMLRLISGNFGPFDTDAVRASRVERRLADGSTVSYDVVELPARFVVEQPGPLTFSPVYVGVNYPLQFSRDLFGDLRVIRERPLRISPSVSVPDVQPLPTEGRPANFTGAVGQYNIHVLAVPTNLRVGDPIQLTINIMGDPIEAVPAPDLTGIPELVENFRVPSEKLAGTASGNRKTFTQTIRAKDPDVKRIPPIEFAYFDPERGEYQVARSDALPLLVKAVEHLDAADLTNINAEPPAESSARLEARDGLRGNKTPESELLATVPPVRVPQVVLTTVAGPVVFAGIWAGLALSRARRNAAAQRRRRALRNAERRIHAAVAGKLPPGEFHSEIEAALAGYLADRLNEPPARFLGRDGINVLRERAVKQDLVQRCLDVVERCEQAAYAGSAVSDPSLADLARQCVKELEREQL